MEELIDYSEQLLREEFRKLPDGTYSWTAWIDSDPGADTDEPVRSRWS